MSDPKPPPKPPVAPARPVARPAAPSAVRPAVRASPAPLRSAAAAPSRPSSVQPARPPARPGAPPPTAARPSQPAAAKPQEKQPRLFDPKQVYYVTSPIDPTALVARRVGIDEGWLHWDDTNKDRQRRAEASEARPGGVVWVKTEKDVEYMFTPITLQLYEEHVRTKVELSPYFETTEALVEFYRTASFG